VRLFRVLPLKSHLQKLIYTALDQLELNDSVIPSSTNIQIEKTRDEGHGNFASNIAMVLAKSVDKNPCDLANNIVEHIPKSDLIYKVEVADPGFINFFLDQNAYLNIVKEIISRQETYGHTEYGQNESILIEFVSANPTGPLHVGHGRGAAYGAAVANLLNAVGYRVDKEYYVNDAGRQMDILALSIWLRYLQLCNIKLIYPEQAYQGKYINSIANNLFSEHGDYLKSEVNLPPLETESNVETYLDELINLAKTQLGNDNYELIFNTGLNEILKEIRTDLEEFGVTYDKWIFEKSMIINDQINACITKLKNNNYIYEKDGAQWFNSSKLGDEKDRVVVRDNGQTTYFASDIAYHNSKIERGYSKIIDIWGADHHGYIARVKAALEALSHDSEKLVILLVQFVSLYRGNEKLQMSTRSGQYITLKELLQEVGKDATRFFYIMRKSEQHLDFDLELAKSESIENPVYYIQYAHARICSVLIQLIDKGFHYDPDQTMGDLTLLTDVHEKAIMTRLTQYSEILHTAAVNYEPHQLGYFLRNLANDFHTYYNACQFLVDDNELRNARVTLIYATRQIIRNGLELLGVSAPESM
jgi:arginyl-tRNA synthetase